MKLWAKNPFTEHVFNFWCVLQAPLQKNKNLPILLFTHYTSPVQPGRSLGHPHLQMTFAARLKQTGTASFLDIHDKVKYTKSKPAGRCLTVSMPCHDTVWEKRRSDNDAMLTKMWFWKKYDVNKDRMLPRKPCKRKQSWTSGQDKHRTKMTSKR